MCGIAGIYCFEAGEPDRAELERMTEVIRHRGPDDVGYHIEPHIGLGFRRLSIIDLAEGHQPLCNEDESVWIVFNGEIYNYKELRDRLAGLGHTFRTHSDTEVIVHLYEEYGDKCVDYLRGMFSFVIWDRLFPVVYYSRLGSDRHGSAGYLRRPGEQRRLRRGQARNVRRTSCCPSPRSPVISRRSRYGR